MGGGRGVQRPWAAPGALLPPRRARRRRRGGEGAGGGGAGAEPAAHVVRGAGALPALAGRRAPRRGLAVAVPVPRGGRRRPEEVAVEAGGRRLAFLSRLRIMENTGVSQWKPMLLSSLGQSCKLAFGNIERKEAAPTNRKSIRL